MFKKDEEQKTLAMGIFLSALNMGETWQRAQEFSNIFLCWGKLNKLLWRIKIPNVIGSDLELGDDLPEKMLQGNLRSLVKL